MKEMIYFTGMFAGAAEPILLHYEEIDGYWIYIINRRSHPCVYINISRHFKSINTADIDCHGGITYTGRVIPNVEVTPSGFYIGWDYAHYGDFFGVNPFTLGGGKRWTTEEMYEEAKDVIRQLKDIKGEKDK